MLPSRGCSWHLPAISIHTGSSAGCENVPPPSEGSLRLRGGFGSLCDPIHTGFVEVFHDEEWGAICNGDAGIALASDVICRQLGFPHGTGLNPIGNPADTEADYYFYSDRGVEESEEPLGRFWLSTSGVICNGPEQRLIDCDLGSGFLQDASGPGPCFFDRNNARLTVACRTFPATAALENVTTPGAGMFQHTQEHAWELPCFCMHCHACMYVRSTKKKQRSRHHTGSNRNTHLVYTGKPHDFKAVTHENPEAPIPCTDELSSSAQ